MPLTVGTRLEHYEILGPLGAGGMGEVYRAADTKLRREVAIKVLPPQFASDPSRLARFEREAQALASLNHPNIAAIYGLEHIDGVRFLVLELVEGPTIAERLAEKRMEVTEVLRIATQIAEAVEAAHEKGIVHRDLKPANVKITPEGRVKVLDFGLAKALSDAGAQPPSDPANSPTITMGETRAGIVLGTASYMSPEQASGKPVDKRSDVWSFGVLLFEMLAGRKAFEGKSVSHIIVHVIEQDPDWAALPPLPGGVQDLLERCLQKEAALRPRDIGDLKLQLQSAITKPVQLQAAGGPASKPRRNLAAWAIAAAAVIVAGVLGFLYLRDTAPPAEAVRFEIAQPGNAAQTNAPSISPDGRKLAFVAIGSDNRRLLWVRSLETLEARPLDATEGVGGRLFWSADSRFVTFAAQDKLKKVEASGGPAQTLCDVAGNLLGGFWTGDNRIVFSSSGGGLMQVAAAGGTASRVTTLGEISGLPAFPSLLPDGHHFLYTVFSTTGEGGVYVGDLDGKPEQGPKRLLADVSLAVYAPSPDRGGYLLFVRGASGAGLVQTAGALMAAPFDPGSLQLAGEAAPVAEDVDLSGFSVSSSGVLVYRTGARVVADLAVAGTQGMLTWFDRQGKVLGTEGDPGFYSFGVKLSPDGTRVALTRPDERGNFDIWIYEFARGVYRRFTIDPGPDRAPVWSPDGSRITFVSNASYDPGAGVYQKAANGGKEELLVKLTTASALNEWSRDGRFLLFYTGGATAGDLSVYAAGQAGEPKIVPLLKEPYVERGGSFSPDGRWFVYTSNESGKFEVYARAFDAASITANGDQFIVSRGGGQAPHWSRDGKEIFYQALDGTITAVPVATSPAFKAGAPQALFKTPVVPFWDVTADGKKFLIPVSGGANSPAPYKVVLNWTSTLNKK